MKYLIVTRKTKYGYDAHVPALPWYHSQGDTEREALVNIKDAINRPTVQLFSTAISRFRLRLRKKLFNIYAVYAS